MAFGSATDPVARGWAVDACYGPSKSSKLPATVQLCLYSGDPTAGGTELGATGGYAPVVIDATDATNFPDAVAPDYDKTLGVTVQFPASTGAFSSGFDYWAFKSPDDHLLDSGQVLDPTTNAPVTITVSQPNTVVRFLLNKLSITVT